MDDGAVFWEKLDMSAVAAKFTREQYPESSEIRGDEPLAEEKSLEAGRFNACFQASEVPRESTQVARHGDCGGGIGSLHQCLHHLASMVLGDTRQLDAARCLHQQKRTYTYKCHGLRSQTLESHTT